MIQTLILLLTTVTSLIPITPNTLNNAGLTAANPGAAAYAVRLLSSSYTGKAMNVRRSSDNTTQDIGFTLTGDLDTAALKTFVGANNGFVTTWYDQSGNGRNLTQATTGSQPAIINAGVIYRRNGLPAIYHDNTDDGLATIVSYLTTTPLSVNLVAGSNSNSSALRRAVQGSANWLVGPYQNYHSWYAGDWNHQLTQAWSLSASEIFTVIEPATNPNTSWRNGVTQTCSNFKGAPNLINTGAKGAYAEPLDGFISELIVFNTDITAVRQTLELNQSIYYNISLPSNLDKNGKFSATTPANFVNRNGAIGVSGLVRTGATSTTISLSAPTTTAASTITAVSAVSGATIASDGGANLTAGICWSILSSPTTADSKTIDAGSAGTYVSSITNLAANTTYYVRAYATNSSGTIYGNQISFTTLAPVVPVLAVTTSATNIRSVAATSGGNITSDGGAAVTARGVCWGITANPTITDSISINGSGSGSFTSSITGLSLGLAYYVRAYATNSAGTGYGPAISFTTSQGVGDTLQGGIIAYYFVSGDPGYVAGQTHGLIVANTTQGTARWYNTGYLTTSATATALGTGAGNTSTIITSQGNTGSYAAKLCRDYNGGGYTDWYLPSKDELNKLYINRLAIGGLGTSTYWSSSEVLQTTAWRQSFGSGLPSATPKAISANIRAIRNF